MINDSPNLNASYNNVIDALKCVAITHSMVNNVSSGTTDEVDIAANSVYPLVHIVPGNVTAGTNQLTFNFNVLCMDLVKVDERNEQQVLSDTMQILVDIIAQYKNGLLLGVQQNEGVYGQADDRDYNLEPFTERFDNVVSGWNCSLSIVVPNNYYACDSYNWSAEIDEAGAWIWVDNGVVNCRAFKNQVDIEDEPVVEEPGNVIVPPEVP
tara:strand:+ start:240 stop:869 length:630 start_codon:yes stop_codon:yes gene_type:complete